MLQLFLDKAEELAARRAWNIGRTQANRGGLILPGAGGQARAALQLNTGIAKPGHRESAGHRSADGQIAEFWLGDGTAKYVQREIIRAIGGTDEADVVQAKPTFVIRAVDRVFIIDQAGMAFREQHANE